MSTQDEVFRPEEIDEQIERLSAHPLAENGDVELIAYLRSFSARDAAQERETLNRMWARMVDAAPGIQQQQPEKGELIYFLSFLIATTEDD